jgi:hypothetical protein
MVYRRWGEQLGISSRSCPRPPIFFSSRAPPPLGTGLQPARARGPRPARGRGGHDGSGAVASAPASPSRRVSPWYGGPRPQRLGGATPCDAWPLGPGGSGAVAHGARPPARRLRRGCLRRAAPSPGGSGAAACDARPPGPGGSGEGPRRALVRRGGLRRLGTAAGQAGHSQRRRAAPRPWSRPRLLHGHGPIRRVVVQAARRARGTQPRHRRRRGP